MKSIEKQYKELEASGALASFSEAKFKAAIADTVLNNTIFVNRFGGTSGTKINDLVNSYPLYGDDSDSVYGLAVKLSAEIAAENNKLPINPFGNVNKDKINSLQNKLDVVTMVYIYRVKIQYEAAIIKEKIKSLEAQKAMKQRIISENNLKAEFTKSNELLLKETEELDKQLEELKNKK